jgi:MFS family permease
MAVAGARRPGTAELAAAAAAQAAVSFVLLGLPAIGPELRASFGLSLAGLGAILAALQFGSGAALISAASAVSRFGARAATLVGTTISVVGLIVAASATTPGLLGLGLFVAGLGGAIVPVAGASTIFKAYPSGKQAWALGVRQMAVPLGGVVAAVAAPQLESAGGTRLFLGVGAGLVLVAGLSFAALCDSAPQVGDIHSPLRKVWRTQGIPRLFVVTCFYIVVLQAVLVYTVPSVRAAGFTSFAASTTYFAVNVTAIVCRLVWGKVADRGNGTRRIQSLIEVGLISAAGAVLFTVARHADVAALISATCIFSFGALGWNALVYALAAEWTPADLADRSFAVSATVVFASAAVVNPALGALAERTGWDAFWLTVGAVALAGTLLSTTLRRVPRAAPSRVG